MSVFFTSCGQNQTNVPKDNIRPIAIGSDINDIGPNIMVRNIKKGRNGTILIAGPNNSSFGDVFRYDARQADGQGKAFTNLTSGIGQHRFWDVLEDRQGNIWFTSTDSGVYYYNTLAPLGAGGKSLPTGQAGLQHFTTAEGLADNRVMSVYEDKAGIIWFGTGGGISRYDPSATLRTGSKSFQNFKIPNPSRVYKGGNLNNDITTIIEDKTGKLWIGTRGDAFVYDGKTFTSLTHKGKTFTNVWSIIEDRKGNIWLGDVTHGLWRYDPSTSLRAGGGTFTKVSERGAYAIIEDKKGNIWTTGPVNSAHVAVWALSCYDAESLYSNKPTVTEIMSGDAFLGILEADDGSIWFGSATGVYRYDASLPAGQGKTITDFYRKEGQRKYILDTKQSVVIWKGSMLFGDGTSTGDVDILKGELLIENRHLVGGEVEIDMNTIEQKFDDQRPHNKLPEFFDVKKYPVSAFAITKVETVNDGKIPGRNGNMTIEGIANMKITGNLTIEGITKAVTFPARMYFKDGMDGTVVLNGTLIIDRTDWGIDYRSEKFFDEAGDLTISDDVKLLMKIIAKKYGR
jgi:polyisoprenoid-binding protein YceI/streptogramin lyase